jgi:nucleoside-diphosphate-sugar epimerase
LDDLSSGTLNNLNGLPVKLLRGSVVDDEILHEAFGWKPDFVYHLAANFANQNSVDYPIKDLSVNGRGTLRLLQYAVRTGVRRFIYTSSSCVYGNLMGPISEDIKEYSLDTPYAITKLLGEQYVRFFQRHHGLSTVIYRLFNSYGPGEYPGKYRNIIPNFMYRALTGKPLIITGSGNETRDYTYVEDTVDALMLAILNDETVGMTFNCGTGKETSIQSLAETIREVCCSDVPIEHTSRREWDTVSQRQADIARIRSILGFNPRTDLRKGLKRTYEWFIESRIAESMPL